MERLYFLICRVLGRLLRAGRYSASRLVDNGDELEVRKARLSYAPLLIALGNPLARLLDTGVTVLAYGEWVDRERLLYRNLYGKMIRVDSVGALMLPRLPGDTLASMLDDSALGGAARTKAVELAVVALADFHARGFTHGDAMAENVMIDLESGVARWFDFETVHDPTPSTAWCRADDLRALIATCLLRTAPEDFGNTLDLILNVYADENLTPLLSARFASACQRPLTFHLGQAGLSFRAFREIGRLLSARFGDR